MTKDNAKTLADRYFRDQCRRMGIPLPADPAPAAKPPRHAFRPRKVVIDPNLVEKDTREGLALERALAAEDIAKLKETGVWVKPRDYAEAFGAAPKMGLDEIWRAGHEMFARDDEWAAFRDQPDDKKQ